MYQNPITMTLEQERIFELEKKNITIEHDVRMLQFDIDRLKHDNAMLLIKIDGLIRREEIRMKHTLI